LLPCFAAFTFLVACSAHEKAGDRAAALGDWHEAYDEYREALSNDPNSSDLKHKYDDARKSAVDDALAKAKACVAAQDWDCAQSQVAFASQVDERNPDIAVFKASIGKSVAQAKLAEARAWGGKRLYPQAFTSLDQAKAASKDPDLSSEMDATATNLVAGAVAMAAQLRDLKRVPEEVALLRWVVRVDGSKQPLLQEAQAELDRLLDAQYDEGAAAGREAMKGHQWGDASRRLGEASRARPGREADRLVQYVDGCAAGEAATTRRDYRAAAQSFRQAIASGEDAEGYAQKQFDRIDVRRYVFHLRSVLLKPTRPTGEAWIGPTDPKLTALATAADGVATFQPEAKIPAVLLEILAKMPRENWPPISVFVNLPDGRAFRTRDERALYKDYDASFAIASNFYDDRLLSFRVVVSGDHRDDAGAPTVRLKDVIEHGMWRAADQSVLALEVSADPGGGGSPGAFDGFLPVSTENAAQEFSIPSRATLPYRLDAVAAQAGPLDYQNELGLDGPPDLYVQIEQKGRVVYESPVHENQMSTSWQPKGVFFYVEPSETLIVRAWDRDNPPLEPDDLVVSGNLFASQLEGGDVTLLSPTAQGFVKLRFVKAPL
jgi:tetratricopeptide (TPR) repeat protein